MNKPLIIGNWKMNPETISFGEKLFKSILSLSSNEKVSNLVICPPTPYLYPIKKSLKGNRVVLGAQDVFWEEKGAHTGSVSASMLSSLGVKYVIVGHSERRRLGETDRHVSLKAKLAIKHGLVPIVCIGEKERDDEGRHLPFLASQVKESLSGISKKEIPNVVIAYEPVWAIGEGSGGAMETRDIHETVLYLRRILSEVFGKKEAMDMRILYGGSVDEKNSRTILSEGGVNGFLVGRVSLDAEKFVRLAKS